MDAQHKAMYELVKTALAEDIGRGDLTSLACLEPDPAKGRIVAKSTGVLSGLIPAMLVFEMVDSANTITPLKQDGDAFSAGDTIVEIDGFNQTVLASERVALNFLSHLSGIATMTREFVKRVAEVNPSCRILDTRKTTPGMRYLEKQAVAHGGGVNHRFGLYDMVLIKDNHIAACGSIRDAVKRTREFLTSRDFRIQFETDAARVLIEVEVENEQQLADAVEAHVDRLLLDNQSPESLRKLVALAKRLNPSVQLEASGNVRLDNVADVAASGVDFISIGAITHSAPVSDFSLKITK